MKTFSSLIKESNTKNLNEASEISLSELGQSTKSLMNTLVKLNYKPTTAWEGIHGVIVEFTNRSGFRGGIRIDTSSLKSISSDPIVRWVEFDGKELTIGLTHKALK